MSCKQFDAYYTTVESECQPITAELIERWTEILNIALSFPEWHGDPEHKSTNP